MTRRKVRHARREGDRKPVLGNREGRACRIRQAYGTAWHAAIAGTSRLAVASLPAIAKLSTIERRLLERVQEVDEIRLLPVGQADRESLVVEVDHVGQGLCRSVVEVRRA